MSAPFEIELHAIDGTVVRFELTEDEIRDRAHQPENHLALAELESGEPDERTRLRRAAYQVVLRLVEEFQITARAHPTATADGSSVWIAPSESLRGARLRDPDAGGDAFSYLESSSVTQDRVVENHP